MPNSLKKGYMKIMRASKHKTKQNETIEPYM